MTLRDIDGDEAAKSHISICSTHSVRLSDPFNDGLLGGKIRKSAMEELEDLLLDSNVPVTGVDKGNHYKEKNRERVLNRLCRAVRITGRIIGLSSVYLPQRRSLLPTTSLCILQVCNYTILLTESCYSLQQRADQQ